MTEDMTAQITDMQSLIRVLEARIKWNLMELQNLTHSIDDESNKKRVQLVHENNLMHTLIAQTRR